MKRHIELYEVQDASGATICFCHTHNDALKVGRSKPEHTMIKKIFVPTAPKALAQFLTDYAGGGGQP